jgi:hypothetical protein
VFFIHRRTPESHPAGNLTSRYAGPGAGFFNGTNPPRCKGATLCHHCYERVIFE